MNNCRANVYITSWEEKEEEEGKSSPSHAAASFLTSGSNDALEETRQGSAEELL